MAMVPAGIERSAFGGSISGALTGGATSGATARATKLTKEKEALGRIGERGRSGPSSIALARMIVGPLLRINANLTKLVKLAEIRNSLMPRPSSPSAKREKEDEARRMPTDTEGGGKMAGLARFMGMNKLWAGMKKGGKFGLVTLLWAGLFQAVAEALRYYIGTIRPLGFKKWWDTVWSGPDGIQNKITTWIRSTIQTMWTGVTDWLSKQADKMKTSFREWLPEGGIITKEWFRNKIFDPGTSGKPGEPGRSMRIFGWSVFGKEGFGSQLSIDPEWAAEIKTAISTAIAGFVALAAEGFKQWWAENSHAITDVVKSAGVVLASWTFLTKMGPIIAKATLGAGGAAAAGTLPGSFATGGKAGWTKGMIVGSAVGLVAITVLSFKSIMSSFGTRQRGLGPDVEMRLGEYIGAAVFGGKREGGVANAMQTAGNWAGPAALAGFAIGGFPGALVGLAVGLASGALVGYIGQDNIEKHFNNMHFWITSELVEPVEDFFRVLGQKLRGELTDAEKRAALDKRYTKMTHRVAELGGGDHQEGVSRLKQLGLYSSTFYDEKSGKSSAVLDPFLGKEAAIGGENWRGRGMKERETFLKTQKGTMQGAARGTKGMEDKALKPGPWGISTIEGVQKERFKLRWFKHQWQLALQEGFRHIGVSGMRPGPGHAKRLNQLIAAADDEIAKLDVLELHLLERKLSGVLDFDVGPQDLTSPGSQAASLANIAADDTLSKHLTRGKRGVTSSGADLFGAQGKGIGGPGKLVNEEGTIEGVSSTIPVSILAAKFEQIPPGSMSISRRQALYAKLVEMGVPERSVIEAEEMARPKIKIATLKALTHVFEGSQMGKISRARYLDLKPYGGAGSGPTSRGGRGSFMADKFLGADEQAGSGAFRNLQHDFKLSETALGNTLSRTITKSAGDGPNEQSFLGKLWNKLWGEDSPAYMRVKVVNKPKEGAFVRIAPGRDGAHSAMRGMTLLVSGAGGGGAVTIQLTDASTSVHAPSNTSTSQSTIVQSLDNGVGDMIPAIVG